jgi:hypothetical protein
MFEEGAVCQAIITRKPDNCVEGSCRLIFVSIENDEMATGVSFAPSASLVEVHAVTSRLFVLDHLEIICRQAKRLQNTITKLLSVSLRPS